MDEARRMAPMVAWLAGLVVVVAIAVLVGHGALAPPDLLHPSTWSAWASGRTGAEAAVAVLRLVVLVLAGYLLAVTLVAVALRLGHAGRLVTAADVLTLPFVRSLVQAGLGVGIAGAAVAGIVAHPVAPAPPTSADSSLVADSTAPVLRQDDPPPPPPPPSTDSGHVDSAEPRADVTRTWTVAPGEHFWSIAEHVVGAGAAEADVERYWRTLVDANRDRLADPDNPDLLFPGQVLSLPSGA